jgi:ribose 5-phosphate isomerase B
MKISIGTDHGGFELKKHLLEVITSSGYDVLDKGAHKFDPNDDYPDFAKLVAKSIQKGETTKGIIICGSGVGASITATKFKGVRAAICHDTYSAAQGVEHDDMNVLCLGARVITVSLAVKIVLKFLEAQFDPDTRFVRRLNKVIEIEKSQLG